MPANKPQIKDNKFTFKNKFWNIFSTLVFLFVIAFGCFYVYNLGIFNNIFSNLVYFSEPVFPELSSPKEVKFNWEYSGNKYYLSETYYQSAYEYYQKKDKGIYQGQEEESINKYLNFPEEDNSISNLTKKIQALGKENGLSSDEILELTASFVQTIPYDFEMAKTNKTQPKYPYEVLYDKKGICSDKTFLATALARELGYGTAVFFYNNQEHMASAIECPQSYSNYSSGYCILESTAKGNKIGIVPQMKSSGQADLQNYSKLNSSDLNNNNSTKLNNPQILAQTKNLEYKGIIKTITIKNEINLISEYLEKQKPIIEQQKKEVENLAARLEMYENQGDIASYNNLVPVYNSQVSQLQSNIDIYNSKVARYNNLINSD